jgi:hypothetical protein
MSCTCTNDLEWTIGTSVYFGAFVSIGSPQSYTTVTGVYPSGVGKVKVECAVRWSVGDRLVLCNSQCVSVQNQCLTVSAVDSVANTLTFNGLPAGGTTGLELANTQGYAFKPANLTGFRLDLEVGEDCRDILGPGAINLDSDTLAIAGSFTMAAGTKIELPGSVENGIVLSSRVLGNSKGQFTVIQLRSPALSTVTHAQGNYVRAIRNEQLFWAGGSTGACGYAYVQTGVLSGYKRGDRVAGRLRLVRGWDYTTYNRRNPGCFVDPRIGVDWGIELWCGNVFVC